MSIDKFWASKVVRGYSYLVEKYLVPSYDDTT